jgi:hypothetical protein
MSLWTPPKSALWYPGAKREELPGNCLAGLWASKPQGVIEHYTVGRGDPFGTLKSEGLGVIACIMRDGSVIQYAPSDHWEWHARDASSRYFGVEHEAQYASDLTTAQMEASAKFTAWLMGTVLGRPTSDVKRSKGIDYTVGIKAHFDGLEDGGTKWDSAIHWNGVWKCDVSWVTGSLRTSLNGAPWTAATYISKVQGNMTGGGDDVARDDKVYDGALTEADDRAGKMEVMGRRFCERGIALTENSVKSHNGGDGKIHDLSKDEDFMSGYKAADKLGLFNVRNSS